MARVSVGSAIARAALGLTRRIAKNLSGGLRYEFSQYQEPSSGSANNFRAQAIFATVTFKLP